MDDNTQWTPEIWAANFEALRQLHLQTEAQLAAATQRAEAAETALADSKNGQQIDRDETADIIAELVTENSQLRQRAEAAAAALPDEQATMVIKELFIRHFGTNPDRYPKGVLSLADWLHLRA